MVWAKKGHRTVSYRFRVEEYRVPTFKVKVTGNKKTWKRGRTANAEIKAEYLHGGNMGGRDLTWEVLRRPKPFAPQGFPKYTFTHGGMADGDTRALFVMTLGRLGRPQPGWFLGKHPGERFRYHGGSCRS